MGRDGGKRDEYFSACRAVGSKQSCLIIRWVELGIRLFQHVQGPSRVVRGVTVDPLHYIGLEKKVNKTYLNGKFNYSLNMPTRREHVLETSSKSYNPTHP